MAPNEPPKGFPHGVYGKYKRATQFFLEWLLRARAHGLGGGVALSASGRVTLDSFHAVVNAIASSPPAELSPVLLHQLPRALAACESAITLRERVAQFFASDEKASEQKDTHTHFLNRLKTWLATLKRIKGVATTVNGNAVGTDELDDRSRFSNYYEVLRVPDDFFPVHEEVEVDAATDASTSTAVQDTRVASAAERKQLFDAVFDEDLQMELLCFMIEMEDLVEQVYATYCDVKREKRTLVEATVVAYAAIQYTQSRVAALQLRYPSITEAEDVMTLLESRMPEELPLKMADMLAEAMMSRSSDHIPGLFLADFMWVVTALKSFTSAIPSDKKIRLFRRDHHFGENYNEEFTPHYVSPSSANYSTFLLQQLPLLYNTLVVNPTTGLPRDASSLPGSFFTLLTHYFESKSVGIPLVFACVCWIKSTLALQGSGGLARNVGLAVARSRDVERRLKNSLEKGEVRRMTRDLHTSMEATLRELETRRRENEGGSGWGLLLQANPLLAGYSMVHDQLRLLHIGGEAMVVTSRLRAFLHLYSALVDRRLLHRMPLFEELLDIYGSVMFTPSHAAAVHGSYSRTYLLSSGMTATAVDAMFRGAPLPSKRKTSKHRDHLQDVSKTARLVNEQDLSTLVSPRESAGLKDGLVRVADQCAHDLLTTRVFSRDLLKLHDDLTDLFHTLCDGLGRRSFYDSFLASEQTGVPRHETINQALENTVMMPLMLFLDCLDVDGTVDTSTLLRTTAVTTSRVSDDSINDFCRRAARIIARRFGNLDAVAIESTYFTLPKYRDVLSREFGRRDFKTQLNKRGLERDFSEVMNLLEDCEGNLTERDVREIKDIVKENPEIFVMISPSHELATLLHHAAAGPAHNPALLEWFIHMGALFWQPSEPFRSESARGRSMIDRLAIHSAASAGYVDSVLTLLEADGLRDLNTPTYRTMDTLAHLAVRNGHRAVYDLLVALGADIRGRNAAGKSVSDLTRDVQWKREILQTVVKQEAYYNEGGPKNREAQFRRQNELKAERLLKSIASRREEERPGANSSASPATTQHGSLFSTTTAAAAAPVGSGLTFKKKNKKGKKKTRTKTASIGGSGTPAAPLTGSFSDLSPSDSASLLHDIRLGSMHLEPGAAEDMQAIAADFLHSKVLIGAAFEKLARVEGSLTSEEQQAAAKAADIILRLQEMMGFFRRPDQLRVISREIRVLFATAAYDAIHLMNKFDRAAHTQVAALPPRHNASDDEKLRQICLMQDYFIGFLAGTAEVLASVDRTTQARELLDVAEKRLLKLQDRPADKFHHWVKHYTRTRKACGLGSASGPAALALLEPYINQDFHDMP